MAPAQSSVLSGPAAASPACRAKYRLRFRKDGDLRMVSHHDLMHCFERMLRRAALPFAVTQGFHPTPRLVFAQSLALGLVGQAEVVELELTTALPAEEVRARLDRQGPPGLTFLSVQAIDHRTAARVRRACYRVAVPEELRHEMEGHCRALLAQDCLCVERTRPQRRRLNVRPYLCALAMAEGVLEMWLWITSHGAARPEEVLQLLGLGPMAEEGCVIERAFLELEDEVGPDAPAPPDVRAAQKTEELEPEPRGESSSLAGHSQTALLPGPLSFDS